jgi:NAD(P)-dependent dehydrogenase (short-subunit alcohol dehydrogenase family)
MDMGISGKGAVIVGGANGIGKAIAEAFSESGAKVAIIDRSDAVFDTALAISAAGVKADVTDYSALQSAVTTIKAAFETTPITHIVYAAGMGSGKFGFPFWNLSPADWPRVLDVNLMGAVNTAHAFVPDLIASGSGSLAFIASIAGQIGSQTDPPYSAAKAGLINFAMCAAKDLAPYGVRVNSICPGMIQTDLNRSVFQAWNDKQPEAGKMTYEEWGASKVKSVAPLGRWQQPGEIAALCVYLASKHGINITGQTLNVDGGQVMHW